MIYTTYFAKLKDLPKNITPISISLYPPKGWRGLQYKNLAPTRGILLGYKKNNNETCFTKSYRYEVLSKLNQRDTVTYLYGIAETDDIALVCYERPESFCHRHIVRDWLNMAGYRCEEYKYDNKGT